MLQRIALGWIKIEGLCQKLGQLGHVGLSVLGQQVVLAGVPSNGGVLLGTRYGWSGSGERGFGNSNHRAVKKAGKDKD